MANNHVSSLLNVEVPKPKRSNFNLGRTNTLTMDVGFVTPVYVEEILPNSHKRLDLEALVQTNATLAPVMGSFTLKFDAFFVPLRLYHQHLDVNNFTEFNDDFDYHYMTFLSASPSILQYAEKLKDISPRSLWPNIDYTTDDGVELLDKLAAFLTDDDYANLTVAPGSLLEYLGMYPAGQNAFAYGYTNKRINAEPLIGYYDIFRNYYVNPHDENIPFVGYDAGSSNSNFRPYNSLSRFGYRYVNSTFLDSFISSITRSSMDLGGSAVSVDVLQLFTSPLLWPDSSPVPWFAGQKGTAQLGGLNYGLLPRTFKDDYFNARFSTEYVDVLEESGRIVVNENAVFINQIRRANRITKYVERLGLGDGRFGGFIKTQFGIKTNNKLCIPEFLGSISSNLVFNDIVSQAQTGPNDGDVTANTALGSRAGIGSGYVNNKGSFVEFNATEPGYLMVMASIVPNVTYMQGIKKMYLKTSFADMYKPVFDAVGYQDLQKFEMMSLGSVAGVDVVAQHILNLVNRNGWEYERPAADRGYAVLDADATNTVVGKHPAWLEYMTSIDESHGLMTQRDQYGWWTFNRPYSIEAYNDPNGDYLKLRVPNIDNANLPITEIPGYDSYYAQNVLDFEPTTYILPFMFNYIFAVNRDTHNFQLRVRFYDRTKQPMSKQILPRL